MYASQMFSKLCWFLSLAATLQSWRALSFFILSLSQLSCKLIYLLPCLLVKYLQLIRLTFQKKCKRNSKLYDSFAMRSELLIFRFPWADRLLFLFYSNWWYYFYFTFADIFSYSSSGISVLTFCKLISHFIKEKKENHEQSKFSQIIQLVQEWCVYLNNNKPHTNSRVRMHTLLKRKQCESWAED